MSYDIRIYTISRPEFIGIRSISNIKINNEGFILPLKNHQIVISRGTPIEYEDIPLQISKKLPGLKYLIECNLEPVTSNEKFIKEMIKVAKIIAKEGIGVIENPQTDEIFLPSGVKRVLKVEKAERFSIIEISWWFNHDSLLKNNNLKLLLETIEKFIPEALPRRYGEYEPPREIFTDITNFQEYFKDHIKNSIVWYPSKPVDYVSLGIPDFIGPMSRGYRFGHFAISIDAAVLTMPGWTTTMVRFIKSMSQILDPFYGDVYILKNQIRSRTVSGSDGKTEQHPIASWWWNGIPRKLGIGLVIGKPLLDYVKIEKPTFVLDNGCKILLNEPFSEIQSTDVKIQDDILQPEPKEKPKYIVYGFNGLYPELWPFSGPKYKE
jgi:hypothetical protein